MARSSHRSRPSTGCCDAAQPTLRPVPVADSGGLAGVAQNKSPGRPMGTAAGRSPGGARASAPRIRPAGPGDDTVHLGALPGPTLPRCGRRLSSPGFRGCKRRKDARSGEAPFACVPAQDPAQRPSIPLPGTLFAWTAPPTTQTAPRPPLAGCTRLDSTRRPPASPLWFPLSISRSVSPGLS